MTLDARTGLGGGPRLPGREPRPGTTPDGAPVEPGPRWPGRPPRQAVTKKSAADRSVGLLARVAKATEPLPPLPSASNDSTPEVRS